MSDSRLLLQIVDGHGTVLRLPGGGALEADLIATITDAILGNASSTFFDALGAGLKGDLVDAATAAIVAKGVGVFKTEAQVTAAITDGLSDVIDQHVRAQRTTLAMNTYVTHGELRQTIRDGIKAAIQALKDDTRFIVGRR